MKSLKFSSARNDRHNPPQMFRRILALSLILISAPACSRSEQTAKTIQPESESGSKLSIAYVKSATDSAFPRIQVKGTTISVYLRVNGTAVLEAAVLKGQNKTYEFKRDGDYTVMPGEYLHSVRGTLSKEEDALESRIIYQ